MLNILLVDDQAIIREGLKFILEQDSQISIAHQVENGQAAIAILESNEVDLILMDVFMPIMNGIEATKIIKKRWPKVKILMLTTFNDEQYAVDALREGANGFLLKTAEPAKILEAIYSAMQGGLVINDEVAAKVLPRLLEKQTKKTESIDLTERERMITILVGEGMTNREISQTLFLSIGTVKNHLTQILQKTNLRDRTQLAIFALKNDIVD